MEQENRKKKNWTLSRRLTSATLHNQNLSQVDPLLSTEEGEAETGRRLREGEQPGRGRERGLGKMVCGAVECEWRCGWERACVWKGEGEYEVLRSEYRVREDVEGAVK